MKLLILLLALNFHPKPKLIIKNAHHCTFKNCPYRNQKEWHTVKLDYYDLEEDYYIDSIHFAHPTAPLKQVKKYVYDRFFTFTN